MKKCDWDNCDKPVEDTCGFCHRPLCEYHLYDSETHDALDQALIDQDMADDSYSTFYDDDDPYDGN